MTRDPRTKANPHPQPPVPASVAGLWADWRTTANGAPGSVPEALDGVTTVVNALVRDRHPYRVTLAAAATASTSVTTRSVVITSAALLDPNLTPDARLAVTTGMALHEAGHVRYGLDHIKAVGARWPSNPTAQRLANVLDDCRLEARLSREYAAYAACFPITLWWVAGRFPIGRVDRMPSTRDESVNLAIAATRYARWASFVGAPVQAEARWWIDWARRYTRTDRPRDLVAGVEAALAHIDALASNPAPEPERPVCPPPPPTPPTDEPEDEPQDEPEDEPGEDEDQPGLKPHPFVAAAAMAAPGAGAMCAECGLPESDPVHASPTPGGDQPGGDEDEDQPEPQPGGEDEDEDEDDEPQGGEDEPVEDGQPGKWDGQPDDDDVQDRPDAVEVDEDEPVDALREPLPLHAADAVTMRDRFADHAIGRTISADVLSVTSERVDVNLAGHEFGVAVTPLVHGKAGTVEVAPGAVDALRGAFAARRTAHDNRGVARSGRLSGARAYRVAAGYDNVFTRRDTVSPDRLDVHILLDLSGSMVYASGRAGGIYAKRYGPDTLAHAITMGAALVEALDTLPTTRYRVWGHTTSYKPGLRGDGTVVYDALDSREGDPAGSGRLAGFRQVQHSGNNDGQAIAAVAALAGRERQARERTVIVVLSDGAPCDGAAVMQSAIEGARRDGAAVISVALTGGLSDIQADMYGIDNVVEWTGDWDSLARDIATVIAAQ